MMLVIQYHQWVIAVTIVICRVVKQAALRGDELLVMRGI